MRVHRVAVSILSLGAISSAMAAPDCSLKAMPQPLPVGATAVPALSTDLPMAGHALGSSDGVFAYSSDEGLAVDRVLSRLRAEACVPASQAQAAGADGAYVPRTKWDNTPYRFNAGGNGKKFSAAEFSAWMEAKGIHVSKGVPQPVPASAPASAPAAGAYDAAQPQH